jgi:hypothetical protein
MGEPVIDSTCSGRVCHTVSPHLMRATMQRYELFMHPILNPWIRTVLGEDTEQEKYEIHISCAIDRMEGKTFFITWRYFPALFSPWCLKLAFYKILEYNVTETFSSCVYGDDGSCQHLVLKTSLRHITKLSFLPQKREIQLYTVDIPYRIFSNKRVTYIILRLLLHLKLYTHSSAICFVQLYKIQLMPLLWFL